MFENILGQTAADRLSADLRSHGLPPALLFSGPSASGKGTTALELARVLSCENGTAKWNCSCASCARHRTLSHSDLLLLGNKNFSAELGAAVAAYKRDPRSSSLLFLIRAIGKLMARFNPVLWEGEEAKIGKASAQLSLIMDDTEALSAADTLEPKRLDKLLDSILSTARKLEQNVLPGTVPIFQIRRAAYWARLAPLSHRKLVIIENIDSLQDSSRNALLKILEEPPESAVLVLTCVRRSAIIPTILSRVRRYDFFNRDSAIEADIIRRVFRDPEAAIEGVHLTRYLDSFLPVPLERRAALADFFLASAALSSANAYSSPTIKNLIDTCPDTMVARPIGDLRAVVSLITEKADGFASPAAFSSFLELILNRLRPLLVSEGASSIAASAAWRAAIGDAAQAFTVYNQSSALCLERLFLGLSDGFAMLGNKYT